MIEPRVDYNYVSDVTDPQAHPGLRRDRHGARAEPGPLRDRQPAARPAAGAGGLGGGDRVAGDRADLRVRAAAVPDLLDPEPHPARKMGPLEGILRIQQGGLLQFDGRIAYDTFAARSPSTSVTAGVNWQANYVNVSWFGSRPVLTTVLPPGSPSPNSDQFRFAARLRPREVLPHRHDDQLRRVAAPGPGGPLAADLQGLLLHGLPRVPGAARAAPRRGNDFRIVVNLKDIGTLLDVNGSLDALWGRSVVPVSFAISLNTSGLRMGTRRSRDSRISVNTMNGQIGVRPPAVLLARRSVSVLRRALRVFAGGHYAWTTSGRTRDTFFQLLVQSDDASSVLLTMAGISGLSSSNPRATSGKSWRRSRSHLRGRLVHPGSLRRPVLYASDLGTQEGVAGVHRWGSSLDRRRARGFPASSGLPDLATIGDRAVLAPNALRNARSGIARFDVSHDDGGASWMLVVERVSVVPRQATSLSIRLDPDVLYADVFTGCR